ncbi:MAG TPA: hypothetical protein VFF69_00035 [Phycisphaerales bacterium]|nr:hypothetical protein [Phycisphaerales bacterium]
MPNLVVVHWKPEEIESRLARLRAGHQVSVHSDQSGRWWREIRHNPPDAVIIDLSRLPSHGRELGDSLRTHKATRGVPILFIGGKGEALARVRALFPGAHYGTWPTIRATLAKALKSPARGPAGPGVLAGYSGTPLVRKLGIKPGATLLLLGAPDDFGATLGDLPEGVAIKRSARGTADVAVLFARSLADLGKRWPGAARAVGERGRLWVAWPKKTSGVATDLSEPAVRRHGLEAGLVDFKICAIDDTWSGLAFTTRKR